MEVSPLYSSDLHGDLLEVVQLVLAEPDFKFWSSFHHCAGGLLSVFEGAEHMGKFECQKKNKYRQQRGSICWWGSRGSRYLQFLSTRPLLDLLSSVLGVPCLFISQVWEMLVFNSTCISRDLKQLFQNWTDLTLYPLSNCNSNLSVACLKIFGVIGSLFITHT